MPYQITTMLYSPTSGIAYAGMASPQASLYRLSNPTVIWAFDPWTGVHRHPIDIDRDPYGHAIVPPGEHPRPNRRARDVTSIFREMAADGAQVTAMLQTDVAQPAQVAVEKIQVDPALQEWHAEGLARLLLGAYASQVTSTVRNHARRVLGIHYQEDEEPPASPRA